MSVSPRQNFWKPPPVPEMPTVTRVPWLAFWNSSATASLIGNTVLDPSNFTSLGCDVDEAPVCWLVVDGPPPHAVVEASTMAAVQ